MLSHSCVARDFGRILGITWVCHGFSNGEHTQTQILVGLYQFSLHGHNLGILILHSGQTHLSMHLFLLQIVQQMIPGLAIIW